MKNKTTVTVDSYLGKSTSIEGTLNLSESIRIDGNYTGKIISSSDVILSESCKFNGDIECDNLILSGSFEGNVDCKGKFRITPSGILKGNINAKLITIDEGAKFNGHSVMNQEDMKK